MGISGDHVDDQPAGAAAIARCIASGTALGSHGIASCTAGALRQPGQHRLPASDKQPGKVAAGQSLRLSAELIGLVSEDGGDRGHRGARIPPGVQGASARLRLPWRWTAC